MAAIFFGVQNFIAKFILKDPRVFSISASLNIAYKPFNSFFCLSQVYLFNVIKQQHVAECWNSFSILNFYCDLY